MELKQELKKYQQIVDKELEKYIIKATGRIWNISGAGSGTVRAGSAGRDRERISSDRHSSCLYE